MASWSAMAFEPLGLTEQCRLWLTSALGDHHVGDPLPGATTATVVPIRAVGHTYVLKWFTWTEFVAEDPERVSHEVQGLGLARAAGIPAPSVIAADLDGSETGHPALLITAVSGASLPRPRDWPERTARAAARLHAFDTDFPFRHVRYFPEPFMPRWASDPFLWRDALELAARLETSDEGIIHRDLHRWNMLWDGGRLSGVVDWLSVCRGPIGEDVGRVWINEILEGNPEGGMAFRSVYSRVAPRAWDVRWEVQSVLDMLPAYLSEEAVHTWGDEAGRARLEDCLRFALSVV